MKILLDTHMLVWIAQGKLPPKAAQYVLDKAYALLFSPVSIWELVIKYKLNRKDFNENPAALYSNLLKAGYEELPVIVRHTLQVSSLPPIHKDPFDRLLLAQAISEGIFLLTADKDISGYPGSVIYVG